MTLPGDHRLGNQDYPNLINLKHLIAVSNVRWNSEGTHDTWSFKLIFPTMVIELTHRVDVGAGPELMHMVRKEAINSMKWWRRLFLTPLDVTGLFINCYIPQHRKNGC